MDWKVGDEIEYFYLPKSRNHSEMAKLYKGVLKIVTPTTIAIGWHNTSGKSTQAYSRDAYIVQHMTLSGKGMSSNPNHSFIIDKAKEE